MMLNRDIKQLVEGLRHEMSVDGRTLELRARIEQGDKDARVVFSGGLRGEHGIWLSVSSAARIRAHWEGYCEAQVSRADTNNKIHTTPEGFQWIKNRSDEYAFGDCFECGEVLDAGVKVYFAGEDDGCPLCSIECAEARRNCLALASDKQLA